MSGASRKLFSSLVLPTAAVASSNAVFTTSEPEVKLKGNTVSLKTRMTSIGHFSLKTETLTHPSVPTFFLALSNPPHSPIWNSSMTPEEFERLWKKKQMSTKHPRFHHKVSDSEGFFEPTEENLSTHVTETLHMQVYRLDLKKRIESLVSGVMDVKKKLWEVQISNGSLGSSGAISKLKVKDLLKSDTSHQTETLLLFRCHHSLGDAVSLVAALSDLLDEADDIQASIRKELKRRKDLKTSLTFMQRLKMFLIRMLWFLSGSIRVLTTQAYLQLTTRKNPFLVALNMSEEEARYIYPGRSVSWCDVASLDEVKEVAKMIGGATINDVFVSCVTAAISKQLAEHRRNSKMERAENLQRTINVVIPVHLAGGILPPGRGIGNFIGAFVAKIPCDLPKETSSQRLATIHSILLSSKSSPAPFLGYMLAKFISRFLPESAAVKIFKASSANAAVAITNSRGFESKVHIGGRTVESMAGFIPLPPGLPLGVVIGSYGGDITLSVNAEKWAVPDTDKFLSFIVDEYRALRQEASTKSQKARQK